jgi:hypothetical protein
MKQWLIKVLSRDRKELLASDMIDGSRLRGCGFTCLLWKPFSNADFALKKTWKQFNHLGLLDML